MAKGFLEGYKTYDTSKGFGNPQKWRAAFNTRMDKEEASTILHGQAKTAYTILELPDNASKADIRKAYRRLIKQWHPDINHQQPELAAQQAKLIIAAYTSLQANSNH